MVLKNYSLKSNNCSLYTVILFLIISCSNTKKEYEDYNEDDFYEVQGIVTKIIPTSDVFDSPRNRDIYYDYYLWLSKPLKGEEKNIDLMINPGDGIIVLVHKDDSLINFYARRGIINSGSAGNGTD
tara:strand:- start:401033 stop:401410 length:378 start_codon:yes stop_codon:yes gene_type:complete